jgi:hypothetical protein
LPLAFLPSRSRLKRFSASAPIAAVAATAIRSATSGLWSRPTKASAAPGPDLDLAPTALGALRLAGLFFAAGFFAAGFAFVFAGVFAIVMSSSKALNS